ncbi:glycosyltransferase family 2 protein [Rhodococcus rhodnii]|uniref:Glycosyltransferase 2-like domain-containing protein n=2 Tax=Rhodococcus rhodnii TaxID=38312 RepID=R7WNP8_9NOCA|nr:glycosyltransferase family A protein [Rhodococcus rhodnii]EOM75629.1 hypothetical protein Rrhod_3089 [Rhodococcus rhodnii LMG 5362]TXG91855.1 glycosyltransferase family 2 protein [Rhodococcus rhodnii]
MKVTVLIPMFDAGAHVEEALGSVLSATAGETEILVVDDGSTDDGAAVVESFGDPRVRLVRQENRGLVATLNRGLDLARGEFVARMDADDWFVPGRIEAQLAAMMADPELVCVGTDYTLVLPDGRESGRIRMPVTDSACRDRLTVASCHCGPSVMLRAEALRESGIRFDPEARHAEDYDMWTRLAAVGRLGNLPIAGYRYRVHDAQVSARYAGEQRRTHVRIAQRYARERGVRPLAAPQYGDLLWAPGDSRIRRTVAATRAATVAVRSVPSREMARFTARKVVEASSARAFRS